MNIRVYILCFCVCGCASVREGHRGLQLPLRKRRVNRRCDIIIRVYIFTRVQGDFSTSVDFLIFIYFHEQLLISRFSSKRWNSFLVVLSTVYGFPVFSRTNRRKTKPDGRKENRGGDLLSSENVILFSLLLVIFTLIAHLIASIR